MTNIFTFSPKVKTSSGVILVLSLVVRQFCKTPKAVYLCLLYLLKFWKQLKVYKPTHQYNLPFCLNIPKTKVGKKKNKTANKQTTTNKPTNTIS